MKLDRRYILQAMSVGAPILSFESAFGSTTVSVRWSTRLLELALHSLLPAPTKSLVELNQRQRFSLLRADQI